MSDTAQRHILVVDDDDRVRTLLSWQLEAEGFAVRCTSDGKAALARIETHRPDLVVLDLSLPGMGGLDVLREVRQREKDSGQPPLAVIILSGCCGETDRIMGLDLGADDYLVKPFSPGELAARVRSVLRRVRPVADRPDPAGITVDMPAHEVLVQGRRVELTAKEFDLLAFLVRNPRQVFTRPQLLRLVWGNDGGWQSEATVTEHIHRLRAKMEETPAHPRWLRTVRGVGYRLEPLPA